MRRAALWLFGAGVTSAALMFALRAQEQASAATKAKDNPPAAAAAATPAAATPAAPEGKVAFTFTDENQMKQFAELWQQRQAAMTKMAILQGYWNQEQGSLAKVNQELLSKYNLDVNKNYSFDAKKKVIVERETPPEQAQGTTPQASDTAQPAPQHASN